MIYINSLKEHSKIFLPKKKPFADQSDYSTVRFDGNTSYSYCHTANGGMMIFTNKTKIKKIKDGYEIIE